MLFFDTITIVLPMGQNVLAKQIVDSIISSIKTYKQIIARAEKYNTPIQLTQQYQLKDIKNDIITKINDLYDSGNFNKNTINRLINGIRDQELDVDIFTKFLISDDMVMQKHIQKNPLNSLQMLKDASMSQIFGKINVNDIFTEICNQKLTLLAYRTKNGYKMTLCSPENIDKTLSKILPTVAYNGNIKINNCAYFGTAHPVFCEKYICNYNNLSQYDIAIIPSISHFSFLYSSATEDAKQQYKNFYEKIFKFFNEKNIPISLQQTSACKGNNFIFALINNIDKDTKIDKLEFSTLNILSGMLLPNFYSKYVDVAVKCFYNTNINNIKIHFSFPVPQEIQLHALPGSIGYATSTIEKILEKAENTGKTEQISILKKILKSFDTTINMIGNNEKQEPKKNIFIKIEDMVINNEQFLSKLKDIKTAINNTVNIHQPFKEWIFTSIDEFVQQNPQNAVSFAEILKNSKFYDEKTMSPTLAGFEVLEKNKNTIQAFMLKHQITEEDLNKADKDIEKKIEDKKDIQEKSTNINNNIVQANNISLVDAMKFFGEMQQEATYTKNQQQSNNVKSDISLQTLSDEKKKQETIK